MECERQLLVLETNFCGVQSIHIIMANLSSTSSNRGSHFQIEVTTSVELYNVLRKQLLVTYIQEQATN